MIHFIDTHGREIAAHAFLAEDWPPGKVAAMTDKAGQVALWRVTARAGNQIVIREEKIEPAQFAVDAAA